MWTLGKRPSGIVLGASAIVGGGILAYINSFRAPFVFDGTVAILDNPTIRQVWPLTVSLHPPVDGSPATGRPFTNFSFAFDYARGGFSPAYYHITDLAIHLGAALLLFGILRRLLGSLGAAWAASFLWMVHPVQTEVVTYVAQRSEGLMGICYLGTLYCFIRATAATARHARRWLVVSVALCLLGMAAKEVMVTAPVMIFLYDRTFLSGSFRRAWCSRWQYYIALGATWLLLLALLSQSGSRGGTLGWSGPVSGITYAAVQLRAVIHYIKLSFWPHPLVIDYGSQPTGAPIILWLDGAVVAALLLATLWALVRRLPAGFLGAWFFGILAPTSSVIPISSELIAEHRLYLPLAAITVLFVEGLRRFMRPAFWPFVLFAASVLMCLTIRRNEDYRSSLALWQQTALAVPTNAGAHNNLGAAMLTDDRVDDAELEFAEAVRLDPTLAGAHNNLGQVLMKKGRYSQAVPELSEAVRLAPTYPQAREGLGFAYYGLGNQLVTQRQFSAAIGAFEASIRLNPNRAEAYGNLSGALLSAGRTTDAIAAGETAVRLKPDLAEAQVNLGNALMTSGHAQDAVVCYRRALALNNDLALAHHNLAVALHQLRHDDEARQELQAEERLRPVR